MYEMIDAVIAIIAGIYLYLVAVGKIQSKIEANMLIKLSNFMKILSMLLLAYGIISLVMFYK
ncbi:MAG: hypothetical protein HRT41_11330 [Campylobacteraceae bacterium]|nr:hypothetical protein [Campylobacteraceae bacterium]